MTNQYKVKSRDCGLELQPRFGPFADWLSATAKMTIPPRAM
jgi:hypothetical protein